MSSYQYRKSHCGDKTVVRSSYLHNGIFNTGKMTSLYWISPMVYHLHCLACIQYLELCCSVHENHGTCRTFPMARPKCLITNLNRIYEAHQTNVWWIMKVQLQWCWTWCHWTVCELNHKWLEMHGCVISIVATDALVLMHQGISIHSVD